MKVQVITDETPCPSCDRTKRYLEQKGINYKEIKITEYRDRHYLDTDRGIPKIVIFDGEDFVTSWTGHSPMRLNKLTKEIR